jgi:hypothetical protein
MVRGPTQPWAVERDARLAFARLLTQLDLDPPPERYTGGAYFIAADSDRGLFWRFWAGSIGFRADSVPFSGFSKFVAI